MMLLKSLGCLQCLPRMLQLGVPLCTVAHAAPDRFVVVIYAAGHAGAGWGGCIVALVREEQVQAFVEQLRQQYYLPRVQAGRLQAEEVEACCFMSTPAAGARVWRSS